MCSAHALLTHTETYNKVLGHTTPAPVNTHSQHKHTFATGPSDLLPGMRSASAISSRSRCGVVVCHTRSHEQKTQSNNTAYVSVRVRARVIVRLACLVAPLFAFLFLHTAIPGFHTHCCRSCCSCAVRPSLSHLHCPDGLVVDGQCVAQDGLSVLDGVTRSQQGVGWGGGLQGVDAGEESNRHTHAGQETSCCCCRARC